MQKSWSLKMLLALRNGVNPLAVPHPDHPEHTVWTLVTNRLDETLAPWENEPLRHAKSVLGIDKERVFGERPPTAPDFGLRALLSRDWILLAALLWHGATPTSKELDETLDLRDRCKNLHANLDIQMKQIMSESKTALPNASAVWNIIHSNFRTHPFDDVPALVVSALDRHRLTWVGGASISAAPARKRSL